MYLPRELRLALRQIPDPPHGPVRFRPPRGGTAAGADLAQGCSRRRRSS
jgi:hypothetical protein